MSNVNPYAAPTAMPEVVQTSQMQLASQNQRFINFIIDSIVTYVLNLGVGIVIGILMVVVSGGEPNEAAMAGLQLVATLLGLLVTFFYYFILEATTGLTLGKMATGTKVVNATGGKASLGQCAGRALCRFIPFEVFSFFGNKGFPIGWHDSIPKTRVIKTR